MSTINFYWNIILPLYIDAEVRRTDATTPDVKWITPEMHCNTNKIGKFLGPHFSHVLITNVTEQSLCKYSEASYLS